MFCHRRKVGALFSYLITFVPISNIPITESMNIILNKENAIFVVHWLCPFSIDNISEEEWTLLSNLSARKAKLLLEQFRLDEKHELLC